MEDRTQAMELDEAKEKFIQSWGALGSGWGINRTMAQVHALLLIAPESLSAEDIMEALNISRGNANMNLRALIDWGLVVKVNQLGERKEFFVAEKDIWRVAIQVIVERRKRELQPVRRVLEELHTLQGDRNDPHVQQFMETIESLDAVVKQADALLQIIISADKSWIASTLLNMFAKGTKNEQG